METNINSIEKPTTLDNTSLLIQQNHNNEKKQEVSESEFSILKTKIFRNILKWNRYSLSKLINAEKRLLARVKSHISEKFIKVRLGNSLIYTITVKPNKDMEDSEIPFVLIHGFGAGLAIWTANYDSLAKKRTVHAFDLLGFARSDRPNFSKDATIAELEFVESIEDWRNEMKINKMILIGHSFGAFIASAYALQYPKSVRHLVLVDPWGFADKPAIDQMPIPVWIKVFGSVLSKFNPLASIRLAGPFGVRLIKSLRVDLAEQYSLNDSESIYEYIYQCNAQNPTGEEAFGAMTKSFGWAKRPMINRFCAMDPLVSVTFICGSKSWIDSGLVYEIQSRRSDVYVNVQIVTGAGHHVYADASDVFNSLMGKISDIVDLNKDSVKIYDETNSTSLEDEDFE